MATKAPPLGSTNVSEPLPAAVSRPAEVCPLTPGAPLVAKTGALFTPTTLEKPSVQDVVIDMSAPVGGGDDDFASPTSPKGPGDSEEEDKEEVEEEEEDENFFGGEDEFFFGGEDEYLFGGETPEYPSHGLNPLEQNISPGDHAILHAAILEADNSDTSMVQIRDLYRVAVDGAAGEIGEPGNYRFLISKEQRVSAQDILGLPYLPQCSNGAWFSDAIVNALIDIESQHATTVFADFDLTVFLDPAYVKNHLDADICEALVGNQPTRGWPFNSLTDRHTRILGIVNPSGNHWMAFEYDIRDRWINMMNSKRNPNGKGPEYWALRSTLPKLLYLASLRDNSPLSGFDLETTGRFDAIVPQQAGSHECGPMSIFFFVRRLHGLPVNINVPHMGAQRAFGQWLREQCVAALHGSYFDGADKHLLRDKFQDPIPTFEDTEDLGDINDLGDSNSLEDQLVRAIAEIDKATAAANANAGEAVNPGGANTEGAINVQGAIDLRGEIQPSTDPRPTITDRIQSRLPQGLVDGTVSELRYCTDARPIGRIELGSPGDNVTSIIVIVRWSSNFSWWTQKRRDAKVLEQEMPETRVFFREAERLACESVADYMRAIGKPLGHVHLVIYVGTGLRTLYLPTVPGVKYPGLGPRCVQWTEAITADLQALTQSTTPVLLSRGADGFACNTDNFRLWLRRLRSLEFVFAVVVTANRIFNEGDALLNKDFFTTVKVYSANPPNHAPIHEARVGTYEPRLFLVREPTPKYANLIEYWEKLQDGKTTHSTHFGFRNKRS
jgi:hypothetical protein